MTVRKPGAQTARTTPGTAAGARKAPAHQGAGVARASHEEKGKYQFVVDVTLAALEEHVNRLAGEQHDLTLRQVLFATGTGFVAVLERG